MYGLGKAGDGVLELAVVRAVMRGGGGRDSGEVVAAGGG